MNQHRHTLDVLTSIGVGAALMYSPGTGPPPPRAGAGQVRQQLGTVRSPLRQSRARSGPSRLGARRQRRGTCFICGGAGG